MVVGVKLGCINHALLTALAIEQAGVPLAGWVANEVIPAGRRQTEYLATLKRMINAPLLGVVPHITDFATSPVTERRDLGRYLDLSLLAVHRRQD